ncbi:MAG: peptide chain release factor N(5)-glutamine methyltransferase [Bacteroidetes bacterium]|nr:peptide chain release factor N(5)-glutamine methyltransferase [Bacteroidota bacterium]
MKSVGDISNAFQNELTNLYDAKEIASIYNITLNEIADLSPAKIRAFPEKTLSDEQVNNIENILAQLKTGKPVQYILGHTEFYGLPFKVNPSVLIPRPETEELVDWIISSVGISKPTVGSILDIGTGSGCIAISLKKNLPDFTVSAMDISPEALQTAKKNAELNKVEINFIQGDILNPKSEIQLPKSKIIVSNPPYVTPEDKKQMHTNVTDFEPHTALFIPENDPLIFYKAIADFAVKNLEKGGLLFFEINENYGEQIVELLTTKPFNNTELRKDIGGKDRMVKAKL